jgi:hypothetical protein
MKTLKKPWTLADEFGYPPDSFAKFIKKENAREELERAKKEQRIREHYILTGRLK